MSLYCETGFGKLHDAIENHSDIRGTYLQDIIKLNLVDPYIKFVSDALKQWRVTSIRDLVYVVQMAGDRYYCGYAGYGLSRPFLHTVPENELTVRGLQYRRPQVVSLYGASDLMLLKNGDTTEENRITRKLREKFGPDRVWGGSWCSCTEERLVRKLNDLSFELPGC